MDLILHNYDFSNFSEKIRLVLGMKGLSWRSVEIPSHLPKPDYTPLTAGYRRTPALQVGADIFCDTSLIVQVLEHLHPQPSVYGSRSRARNEALSSALAHWAEGPLLWPTALYITGVHAGRFPDAFHRDRAVLHNKPQPSLEQVRNAGKNYYAEMCKQLGRIESLLDDGHPYILGEELTLADLMIYGTPFLLEVVGGTSKEIDAQPKTRAWLNRIGEIGHGNAQPLTASGALDIARDSEPQPIEKSSALIPSNTAIGDAVTVSPRDEQSPAAGVLQFVDSERITIRSSNDRTGNIHVHFPRVGYRISKARPST